MGIMGSSSGSYPAQPRIKWPTQLIKLTTKTNQTNPHN